MDRKKILLRDAVWQIVSSFAAHSTTIQVGISMAYSTILLPQIMQTDGRSGNGTELASGNDTELRTELIVDKDEASWIASLVTLATPVGSLLTGPLMDRFGRKNITILTTIPFIISWILITTTTDSVYTIYAARLLAGLAGGLSTVVLVYVSEISHPAIRPMLLSLTSVFVSFGILLTLLLNYFLTWKVVGACCGAVAGLSLLSILFIPESPAWIVGFQRSKDPDKKLMRAERNLKWLYKNAEALEDYINPLHSYVYSQPPQPGTDFETEYKALVKIKEQKLAARKDLLFPKNPSEPEVTFRSPQAWKPLLILFIIFTLQQFSGGYIVIFYAVQIFQESGSLEVDHFLSVVILGVIRFVMALVSMYLSRRFGRRPLLISSAAGMSLSVLFAAVWMHFFSRGIVPVVCLLLFVLFASYGIMVIPWTLIGELLPLNIRGKGSGFMVAVAYLHMFVTVKLFISILDSIGVVLLFVSFSGFSLVFVIFVYFKIPETLGKSFHEIENYFK